MKLQGTKIIFSFPLKKIVSELGENKKYHIRLIIPQKKINVYEQKISSWFSFAIVWIQKNKSAI